MPSMYDRNAPAKLLYWPAEPGSGKDTLYPRLQDALCAAAEEDGANAWIITEAGDILNPRMIAELQFDVKPERERCPGALRLLGVSPFN